jgi:hypothetical protein
MVDAAGGRFFVGAGNRPQEGEELQLGLETCEPGLKAFTMSAFLSNKLEGTR